MPDQNTDFEKFRKQFKDAMCKQFGSDKVCGFWGDEDAKIVSIGQAPSQSGIKNQKPWSDKSGQKLRNEWYKISEEDFYNKDNFYLTAMGMYFPGKDKQGGDLRPDVQFAKIWLTQEVSYLNPKLYLIIGRMAAEFFFPKKDFKELIFKDQKINGIKTYVLPHPSPVNIKWFKDNPEFEKSRIPVIRKEIHKILFS